MKNTPFGSESDANYNKLVKAIQEYVDCERKYDPTIGPMGAWALAIEVTDFFDDDRVDDGLLMESQGSNFAVRGLLESTLDIVRADPFTKETD